MSKTGPYNDTPFQIEHEGQTIDLTFTKTTPDTATIKWNIPAPAVGCGDDQGAYNGIVITMDDKSVLNGQRPVNATYYTADPTADTELHAGDKIGDAVVVGAFYDDDTTTSLEVSDIVPNRPYYFSAYAVDKQGRYHRDGVHAYSLEWAKETKDRDYPGYQEVRVLGPHSKKVDIRTMKEPVTGTLHGQWTGLPVDKSYILKAHTDKLGTTDIEIEGATAQTYEDFVKQFNEKLALAIAPSMNAGAPNIGNQYVDVANKRLYTWNGTTYDITPVLFDSDFPNNIQDDDYWFKPSTNTLQQRVLGEWEECDFYVYHKPFNSLDGSDFWINGNQAMAWEGTTWCSRPLVTSPIDPSLSTTPSTGAFWYNTEDGIMYMWDDQGLCWKPVNVIFHETDPNTMEDGALWYNTSTHVLYVRTAGAWVKSTASDATLPPRVPADGTLWVDVANDIVKQYDFTAKTWVKADVIYWGADPTNRKSCDKWWQSVGNTNKVFVWDFINSVWVESLSFTESAIDPRDPQLPVNQIWNRTDGHYFLWDGMEWTEIAAIEIAHDPRTPVLDEILKIGSSWSKWNGSAWISMLVDSNEVDPSALPAGTYWYDTTARQLKLFNGLTWSAVQFSIRPQVPAIGTRYYDTVENKLKEWKSGKWVDATLPLRATINELNNLMFIAETTGSASCVAVEFMQDYRDVAKPWFYVQPAIPGSDAISDVPSYKQLGVGTDGSVDERREVINAILTDLGMGSVTVELTKAALERCIDSALETLRQKSSASVKRGFMFMEIQEDKQTYILSSKRSDYDKISQVNGVFRVRGGRIGSNSYNDPFEQSMIQQLYFAGSFDLLSYHLLSAYNELLNEMFANNLMFTWNEYNRTLMLHQYMRSKERVLLDVMVERTEQDLLVDRYTRPWLIKFATAKAMMILAEVRGKYASLPGAGGGVSLNASDLRGQATEYFEQCVDDIDNFIVNSVEDVGLNSGIMLG